MVKKPTFLKAPYSGYYHREVPKEDEELTHVSPGTPCGEYLRRFWQPVAYSDELRDLPMRKRIMGEDLVLFRDFNGQVGLLELHCSHRGTSLEFGSVSQRGIRCCYHGWLYDVDGRILETPGEPPESTLKDRLFHGAYPTHEYKGLIFAYMGPPQKRPPFPKYDTFELPGYRLVPGTKYIWPCNWTQLNDNNMDPAHTAFLHTIVSGTGFTKEFGLLPELDWMETPIGMVYIATRRVGDNVWVRMIDSILPNLHQIPPVWEDGKQEKIFSRPLFISWRVPIDDTTTLTIGFFNIHESVTMTKDEIIAGSLFGQTADRPYEERQRVPGDYDAHVGQRPIAVHALEHLGATDSGVIMLRKLVRRGIRAIRNGEDPTGVVPDPAAVIPTYGQNTVLRIPPARTLEADKRLLRETGRKVARGHYL